MTRRFALLSSSFEYTRGVLPVARRLEQSGFSVYWISFRAYEMRWLIENGVVRERILDTLADFGAKRYADRELTQRLLRLEDGSPPLVNDIILMDRLLRRKDDSFAYAYLAHLEEVLSRFLQQNEIRFVSAGRDTALQLVCSKVCARLGIPSVVPTVVRMPDDRFGFCLGHTESEFVSLRAPGEAERFSAREFLKEFRDKKPIPSAVLLERRHNAFLRRIPHDVRLATAFFMRSLPDRHNDFTRYSLARLAGMYVRRRLNALHVRLRPIFEPVGDRPFVVYGYHMQPESTVDVLASYFFDQPALIRQIARSLPASHELYLKPHPDHVGGLSRRQLMELKSIPGVRLVSPFLSSHDLMMRASIVFTLTGTMSMQAALHRVPSIIFAPQFFRRLPGVHYCRSPLELPGLIPRVLARGSVDQDGEIVEFLAHILANSFAGRQSPYGAEFSEAEIEALVGAYSEAYAALAAPAAAERQPEVLA